MRRTYIRPTSYGDECLERRVPTAPGSASSALLAVVGVIPPILSAIFQLLPSVGRRFFTINSTHAYSGVEWTQAFSLEAFLQRQCKELFPSNNAVDGMLALGLIKRMSDDSSDSPSRTSENVQLLLIRKKAEKQIGPHRSEFLSTLICIVLALVLMIVFLFLAIAFYHVKHIYPNCDGEDINPYDLLVQEQPKELEATSMYLKDRFLGYRIVESINFLANGSHIAGSKESAHLMHYLANEYSSLGYSVKIYNYTVLLNYPQVNSPNTIHVDNGNESWKLLSTGRGTPLGPEDAKKEQEDARSQHWWNAYSANGTADAQIVYCNYGMKNDFEQLLQMGIELRGRIALMRYGGIRRSEKVRLAQSRGLVAVILFSDPIHYTSAADKSNVFPESTYLPGDDAQRGSVLATHGDPLTPLLPSLHYVHREENEESARLKGVLPNILVTPIGYNDAKKIMDLLDGEPVPSFEWKGGLSSVYRVTGEKKFRVTVHSKFVHRVISNVVAMMPGSKEPNHWVMVGNHVDSWVNGAIDPISGTATQLEMARVAADVFQRERPRRTIVFCHWDAEEFGLIGSTEWVEEMQHVLGRKAVAYINVDHIAGNIAPDVKAVPLLYRTIIEASKKRNKQRQYLFDSWRHYRGKGQFLSDREVPHIGLPTAGSDYHRFISFSGIPAADLKLEGTPGLSYPLYHTMYETPWLINNLVIEPFNSFVAMGRFWMEIIHRLANYMIIPFNVVDYANFLSALIPRVETNLSHLNISSHVPSYLDKILSLKDSLRRFGNAARRFQEITDGLASGEKKVRLSEVTLLNDRLQALESCFLDPTRSHSLDRHIVFSQSKFSPQVTLLAGIQDAAHQISLSPTLENVHRLSLEFSKFQAAVCRGVETRSLMDAEWMRSLPTADVLRRSLHIVTDVHTHASRSQPNQQLLSDTTVTNMSLLAAVLVFSLLHSVFAAPPIDVSTQPVLGSIQGSPVVAVVHGLSDVLKDDIQSKDTEDDPLQKFGRTVE
ncbi:unnamed protein product [Caenorhabditis auriculariae]|uniref:Peptidase M28 domain-containing protein n=1 Tax=Caenorhabditis auriculariae TaxID=2777116 RepID=A0A8S1GNS0_9PELO|nr:unnamed protein product [Caenorhabditis auriculariae]